MPVALRSIVVAVVLAASLLPAFAQRPASKTRSRPNVVFILADDLGWSDTSLYGTTRLYETPNIERLAKRGMRLRNAYAASPICSPTRASILTGQYPARLGITSPVCHVPEELFAPTLAPRNRVDRPAQAFQSATRLRQEYVTVNEVLGEAGYRTAHFGKWHLGREPYDALHQGFDVDIPHTPDVPGPGPSYRAPWKFVKDPRFTSTPGEHIEDRLSTEAAQFIRANRDRPFYINYWAYSVHSSWDAKPELIEAFKPRVNPADAQHNPLYAAMVKSLDDAVGRIIDAVDECGIAERTIIIFFSDNGGYVYKPNHSRAAPAEYLDMIVTSNAPLRAGKGTLYEGGTRVPCVVDWPGHTPADSASDALLTSVDWYPTILEMCGLAPPAGTVLDGVSQVSALRGKAAARDRLFCFYPHYDLPPSNTVPGTYVRRDDWKLIRLHHDGPGQADRFELYNLHDDVGETHNLAAARPDLVKELDGLIDGFLRKTGALVPGKNPAYTPDAAAVYHATGWQANPDCTLAMRDGRLVIQVRGKDPVLQTAWTEPLPPGPLPPGPLTLELRMQSTATGRGQLFWEQRDTRPPHHRDRSVLFDIQHDGAQHDYRIAFQPQRAIVGLRLDPAQGPGLIQIERLRLQDAAGQTVREWKFDPPPPAETEK
jgi:arylsulfatase A-like enzyme